MLDLQRTTLDERIWRDELEEFVPNEIFDVHTHIYDRRFATPSEATKMWLEQFLGERFAIADWPALDAADEILMPGRTVRRLSFPFPFPEPNDFERANAFVAREVYRDHESAALMLVHPSMSASAIEAQLAARQLIGLKPYRIYTTNGDPAVCRITDFLPEHQIAVADKYGLIVMMHLSMPDGIGDATNQRDLLRLSEKYPRVRWILAHCARSYFRDPIEQAAPMLRQLSNAWYDTSSVCDADAIAALIEVVGIDRVMYGSDDLPVGAVRGKYITFGRGWAFLSETNHSLSLSHCDARMTFVRYEQLRAMKRACQQHQLSEAERRDLFYNTAARLVHAARRESNARESG